MSSLQSLQDSSFLEHCSNKKQSIQEIHEALGIYKESSKGRKEPEFAKDGANDLHKKILKIARSFRTTPYKNVRERKAALINPNTFSKEIDELMLQYGHRIWDNTNAEYTWEDQEAREVIRFLVRCWIIRESVQHDSTTPRKSRGQVPTIFPDSDESDQSEAENFRTPSRPRPVPRPIRTNLAPEAPNMVPSPRSPVKTPNAGTGVTDAGSTDHRSNSMSAKRKAAVLQGSSVSGRLPKVRKSVCGNSNISPMRQQDVCSFPEQHLGSTSNDRRRREETCDTTRTLAAEEDCASDRIAHNNECNNIDKVISSPFNVEDTSNDNNNIQHLSTAGPSETYRNPHRLDSATPTNTQPLVQPDITTPAQDYSILDRSINRTFSSSPIASVQHDINISDLDDPQILQLRFELFKLLLSYIIGINQFDPTTYSSDAEKAMNNLLYQFWERDTSFLQERLGDDYNRSKLMFETWMQMRHRLDEFRAVTQYWGIPGEDWVKCLRDMDLVPRAKASIAYVDLKAFSCRAEMSCPKPRAWCEDLATVFDILTRIEGLNGKEAFEGLRRYNEILMQWYR